MNRARLAALLSALVAGSSVVGVALSSRTVEIGFDDAMCDASDQCWLTLTPEPTQCPALHPERVDYLGPFDDDRANATGTFLATLKEEGAITTWMMPPSIQPATGCVVAVALSRTQALALVAAAREVPGVAVTTGGQARAVPVQMAGDVDGPRTALALP